MLREKHPRNDKFLKLSRGEVGGGSIRLAGGDAGIKFGDLLRGAELIAKRFVFRPFLFEFEQGLAEHPLRVKGGVWDVGMGADEAVDGAGGIGEGVEEGLGFIEIVNLCAEFSDLAGEDAHDLDLVFEGADGGFFETIKLRLGQAAGVEAVSFGVLVARLTTPFSLWNNLIGGFRFGFQGVFAGILVAGLGAFMSFRFKWIEVLSGCLVGHCEQGYSFLGLGE